MAFCTKCGNRISAGQKFCSRCGEPVSLSLAEPVMDEKAGDEQASEELYTDLAEENPEGGAMSGDAVGAAEGKAASGGFLATVGGKIAVISAAAVLTAGAAFGGVKLVQHVKEERAYRESAATDGPVWSPEDESGLTEENTRIEASSGESSEDMAVSTAGNSLSESAEEEESQINLHDLTDEEVRDRIYAYLEESLIPEYGVFNPLQVFYGAEADGTVERFSGRWDPESADVVYDSEHLGYSPDAEFSIYDKRGIISAAAVDFTGDGLRDLLIIYGPQDQSWDQPFSAALYILTEDGLQKTAEQKLEIEAQGGSYTVQATDIHLMQNKEDRSYALLLYYEGQHSDVSLGNEACLMLPQEDFNVAETYHARLGCSDSGVPQTIDVTREVHDDPSATSGVTTYLLDQSLGYLDEQARMHIMNIGRCTEVQRLTDDFWNGARDCSGFLSRYMLQPREEMLSGADIVFERDQIAETNEDYFDGTDQSIAIDTLRFSRKDGKTSPILNKINAIIRTFTDGSYERVKTAESPYGYYEYTVSDPVITDDYISVQGYVSYYVIGGVHGWGMARSWTFSLETGDPMDIRIFTGLSASEIQQGINEYFKDSGEVQKNVYEAMGLQYVSVVTDWENGQYPEQEQSFRNFYVANDGWVYLEEVSWPPASGGNMFPSRVIEVKNVRGTTGNPNAGSPEIYGLGPEKEEGGAASSEESETSSEEASSADAWDPWGDSGVEIPEEKVLQMSESSDYLWLNIDVETGRLLTLGYLGSWDYNGSYTAVYHYHDGTLTLSNIYVDENYGGSAELIMNGHTAKELVDHAFSMESAVFTSGGRLCVVWDSPNGLCAYDHKAADYTGGNVADLRYTLNEDEIEEMLRSISGGASLRIPRSERQE